MSVKNWSSDIFKALGLQRNEDHLESWLLFPEPHSHMHYNMLYMNFIKFLSRGAVCVSRNIANEECKCLRMKRQISSKFRDEDIQQLLVAQADAKIVVVYKCLREWVLSPPTSHLLRISGGESPAVCCVCDETDWKKFQISWECYDCPCIFVLLIELLASCFCWIFEFENKGACRWKTGDWVVVPVLQDDSWMLNLF